LKGGKKHIVKVVLSKQQKELLNRICQKLGQSESETLRKAFLQYAEKLSLITEKVHSLPGPKLHYQCFRSFGLKFIVMVRKPFSFL